MNFKAGDVVADEDGRPFVVVEVIGGEHDGRWPRSRLRQVRAKTARFRAMRGGKNEHFACPNNLAKGRCARLPG
jgi:hypothetical protein